MARILTSVVLLFGYLRCLPHMLLLKFHPNKLLIEHDIHRWLSVLGKKHGILKGFVFLMVFYPEYRNLFYHRIGSFSTLVNFLCRKKQGLYLSTRYIGSGLFIQHGDATILAAKKIGENCWINQGVTVGYTSNGGAPVIGDQVTINAGAKVLGEIRIGNNVVIGANAVVVKNVPDNCTVVGVPAYIIKRDGQKVREELN